MSEEMHRLLTLDDRGVSEAQNTPAMMFRSLLIDLKITPIKWDRLMSQYTKRTQSSTYESKSSSDRSNINRALCKPTITWKMFRTGLSLLAPQQIDYHCRLTWQENLILPVELPQEIEYTPKSRQNELVSIYHQLWVKLRMAPRVWDQLIERYLHKVVGDNPPDLSTERGNLFKAIIQSRDYTWQTFCRGLKIIGVEHLELTITLHWHRRKTYHPFSIDINQEQNYDR